MVGQLPFSFSSFSLPPPTLPPSCSSSLRTRCSVVPSLPR
jgi:hypothetical protein